jgi:hypothetical protein
MNEQYGQNPESKRIKRKPVNYTQLEQEENKPMDFNKGSYGEINYDPVFGWIEPPFLGKNSSSTYDNRYKNKERRNKGLPGSSN